MVGTSSEFATIAERPMLIVEFEFIDADDDGDGVSNVSDACPEVGPEHGGGPRARRSVTREACASHSTMAAGCAAARVGRSPRSRSQSGTTSTHSIASRTCRVCGLCSNRPAAPSTPSSASSLRHR